MTAIGSGWYTESRNAWREGREPAYTHCQHIYEEGHWPEWQRKGPWCHLPPMKDSEWCRHHDPDRRALDERRRSSRRRLDEDHAERLKRMGIDW